MSADRADQLGLFAADAPPAPTSSRSQPPARGRARKSRSSSMGNPALVVDALTEVRDGRFGLLDDTDTCLVFEDHDRVRIAQDDALLASLRSQGFIELSPPRDTVSCLHGARRRPVTPLRLTRRGRDLLHRWSSLKPLT